MRKLNILEPSQRESGPILICDDAHNDVAEFFHNEHATVSQSYETALVYARHLTASSEAVGCLQSIADMKDGGPSEPDDADWRAKALECKRAAQRAIAALSTPSDAVNESAEARLREALTPSAATKAAYIGEFHFFVDDRNEDGEECTRMVTVPWTTTKEIMKAILDRAISAVGDEAKESGGRRENQPEGCTGPHRESGETNSGATGDSILTRSAVRPSDPIADRREIVAQDDKEAFEKAWAKRPWLTEEESDKDRALRWWMASAAHHRPVNKEIVVRIKADPGDGTVAPDIAHVLARGFHAMGWSNPQGAAEDMIDAILAALDGGAGA